MMNKRLLLIVLSAFLMNVLEISAQSRNKNGDYYYKVRTYDRAIKAYKRELRKKPNNIQLLKKITDSYLNSNMMRSQAIQYAERVIVKERTPETVLKYGMALFYGRFFNRASKELEWVQIQSKSESDEYKTAQKYLNWILNAKAHIVNPLDVKLINLGKQINTNKSEINPFVTSKEDKLVYSSNKRYHSNIGANYYNVNFSLREKDEWSKGKSIGYAVNSGFDEIVAGYTPDGSDLFVFHNQGRQEQIGYSEYEGGYRFSELHPFGNPIDQKGGEYGVWLTQTKDTLYYVSENENGDTDIYYALKLPNGKFGLPRPIPGFVNSKYDENFPVLSNNGKRLYFSSNGENSIGGYDLFYSDWNDVDKEWGNPVNLGYPINDTNDNYNIGFTHNSRYAYISSIQPEGHGERDIYKVVFNEKPASNTILKCSVELQTDTGNIVPPYEIIVELSDSVSNKKIGSYTCSYDSAKFVMAIEPGIYKLTFLNNLKVKYSDYITIPEMSFENIPENRVFIIPKETQIKSRE